jgi:epoxyqueuosine reductase
MTTSVVPWFVVREEIAEKFRLAGLENFSLLGSNSIYQESNPLWRQHVQSFKSWIRGGNHGSMGYLARNLEVRADPRLLLDGSGSTFVFLVPYDAGHQVRRRGEDQQNVLAPTGKSSVFGMVARYARHRDYHRVIKRRLSSLFSELSLSLDGSSESVGGSKAFNFRVVVDSIPFLDRAHAHMAGLGFVGRNTLLIRPGIGSYFFIASVIIDCEPGRFGHVEDRPAANRRLADLDCGECNLCVESCPTGALLGDSTMDARRCVSYLSIEHRGKVPEEFLSSFAETMFGCDICQEVCPYNFRTEDARRWSEFRESPRVLQNLEVIHVAVMSPSEYEQWFGGLPLTRAKFQGLVRNALYSLFALGDLESLQKAIAHWESQQNWTHISDPESGHKIHEFPELAEVIRHLKCLLAMR